MSTFVDIVKKLSTSISLKVGVIGFMILILLIPTEMIKDLIRERKLTRDEVVNEISNKWGDIQNLTGPVIVIPFYTYQVSGGETVKINKKLYVLPESLNIDGELNPEIRYRGIYKVIVYKSGLQIDGNFLLPDFEEAGIDPRSIDWKNITVVMGLTDMRGIQNDIRLIWNGEAISVDPGVKNKNIANTGFTAKVLVSNATPALNFKLKIDLNGSYGIHFTPVGKTTRVKLVSGWSTPSFGGSFLPDSRSVSSDGFEAEWTVLHLNRNYPQSWIDNAYTLSGSSRDVDWQNPAGHSDHTFGVNLLFPVDEYQMSMRSAKYAIMFISLTFLIFLFVEILNKKRIHPVQYLLVSFGLLLFYTLLLSLSEHIGFDLAYLISSLAIISLISIYSFSVLRSMKLAGITSVALLLLYAFLFVILQAEDYSLLMGSVGLFIILGLVMVLSKRINWYGQLDDKK